MLPVVLLQDIDDPSGGVRTNPRHVEKIAHTKLGEFSDAPHARCQCLGPAPADAGHRAKDFERLLREAVPRRARGTSRGVGAGTTTPTRLSLRLLRGHVSQDNRGTEIR